MKLNKLTQYVTPWGRQSLQFSASDGELSLEFRKSQYWSSPKSLKTVPLLIHMAGHHHCLGAYTTLIGMSLSKPHTSMFNSG